MEIHIRKLGIYSVIVAAISGLAGALFFTVLDGASYLNDYEPLRGVTIFCWMLLMTLLAIPYLITGLGLIGMYSWARPLGTVLYTFSMLNVPLGTALGVYGFWVLLSPEADEIFSPRFDDR